MMQTQILTRQQVVELAMKMPPDKLAAWYEFGLFIESRPLPLPITKTEHEIRLADEVAQWEAASNEDWLNFEDELAEAM